MLSITPQGYSKGSVFIAFTELRLLPDLNPHPSLVELEQEYMICHEFCEAF